MLSEEIPTNLGLKPSFLVCPSRQKKNTALFSAREGIFKYIIEQKRKTYTAARPKFDKSKLKNSAHKNTLFDHAYDKPPQALSFSQDYHRFSLAVQRLLILNEEQNIGVKSWSFDNDVNRLIKKISISRAQDKYNAHFSIAKGIFLGCHFHITIEDKNLSLYISQVSTLAMNLLNSRREHLQKRLAAYEIKLREFRFEKRRLSCNNGFRGQDEPC